MLVPPTSSSLLGSVYLLLLSTIFPFTYVGFRVDLDPTKLKARQFSRGTPSAVTSKNDTSLWTETPAERQQRLADEVSGKKRRITDAPVDEDLDEKARKRRRKEEEEAIRRGVEEHTVRISSLSLWVYVLFTNWNYVRFLSVRNEVQR